MQKTSYLQKIATNTYFIVLITGSVILTFFEAGFTFYPLVYWVFVITFLFFVWLIIPNKNWELVNSYKPLYILAVIHLLYILIRLLIPPFSQFGFKDLAIFTSFYFVFFSASTIRIDKILLRKIFSRICFVAFIIAIYGILKYIFLPYERLVGPFIINSDPVQLLPNALGFFILLIIPLQVLSLFKSHSSQKNKINWQFIYYLISSIIIFTAFFLILSRATFIALFAISIIFIALQLSKSYKNKKLFKSKSIKRLLVIFLMSFILLSAVNIARSSNYDISTFENYLNLDATENTVSFFDRFDYMKGALMMNLEYPIFGIGSSNFQFFYPQYQAVAFNSTHPYSFMLRLAAELGSPGAIMQTLFFILMLYYLFKNLKNIHQKYYVGALGFALLGSSIQAMLNLTIDYILNFTILSLFAALFINRFPIIKKDSKKIHAYSITIFIGLVISGLFIVTINEYKANEWAKNAINSKNNADYISAAYAYNTAAEERIFKMDYMIQSAEMYKSAFDKNELNAEQMNEWIVIAKKATETNPHYSRSWNAYGNALYASKNNEEALNMYEKALELDSKNYFEYYVNLINVKKHNNSVTQEDIEAIKQLLTSYIDLLEKNPYVLSKPYNQNHKYAKDLFECLVNDFLPDNIELYNDYQKFLLLNA